MEKRKNVVVKKNGEGKIQQEPRAMLCTM